MSGFSRFFTPTKKHVPLAIGFPSLPGTNTNATTVFTSGGIGIDRENVPPATITIRIITDKINAFLILISSNLGTYLIHPIYSLELNYT